MATLKGRALLGWMQRDDAIRFLVNDCVFDPPMSQPAAAALWQTYRDRVNALPDRPQQVAANLGLTAAEAGHAARFMAFVATQGHNDIIGVQKVDVRELVVRQFYVATTRSDEYAARLQSPQDWLNETLPCSARGSQYQVKFQQQGLNTYSEIDIPHAEWIFTPTPQGIFVPAEALRHVTTMTGPDRTFLWAGYHRSFATVLSTPAANVPSAVVAVARNVLVSPINPAPAPGVAIANVIDPLGFFGAKAARFGDFFVDGLFMEVNLRKKRYQLQVHANWVAIDDPT
jgi:hypothetical protein